MYDAGFFDYFAFLCGATPGSVSPSLCASLVAAGFPTDASDLNYPSIGIADVAGSQTVTRTVTSVADRTVQWRADVHPPAGFDVVVEPATITLEPGESASYTVTFTANGAVPAGEWTFGDLVWKGNGGYAARSPIALKGVPIGVPEEVAGTGTAGSLSFDVDFGYSGPYTAAPHGLVPEVLLSGEVFQDPDQTFPSPDDTDLTAVRVPFPLEGAAFARIALGDPGRPRHRPLSGRTRPAKSSPRAPALAPTSTSISNSPPTTPTRSSCTAGRCRVAVPWRSTCRAGSCRWRAVAVWPSTAPPPPRSSARRGPSTVSWAGLDPGGSYLGAVSHSDGAGLLGLTLVAVES